MCLYIFPDFIFVFLHQVSIDEDLKDCREVSFQAALLYTSSKVMDGVIWLEC